MSSWAIPTKFGLRDQGNEALSDCAFSESAHPKQLGGQITPKSSISFENLLRNYLAKCTKNKPIGSKFHIADPCELGIDILEYHRTTFAVSILKTTRVDNETVSCWGLGIWPVQMEL